MPQEAVQSGKSFRSFLGVPPSSPTPKDSVYVIVDAQNEYDHGLLAISNVSESRANIGAVLKKYREAGGDVVHVKHSTPDGAPLFTPGTELAEEFEELKPREGEKVRQMIGILSKGCEGLASDSSFCERRSYIKRSPALLPTLISKSILTR